MSADDQGARRAADDGLRVVEHLGHRHPDGRLVAEHDLAERIADEEHRDPGLVEDLGGRVVVGGQHRDPRAVGVQLARCRRRSGGGRCPRWTLAWRSCWLPRGLGRRHQSARRRRARPARGRPGRAGGRRPRASTGAAGRRASRRRRGSRPGWCRCRSPEPGSATSLATSRSTPLRRSLSAARSSEPVSAANPTRTGRGRSGSRVAAPSESRPRAIRADLGQQVRGRLELEGQPVAAGELGVGPAGRPEVGDRGGHDQRVEPGRAVAVVGRAQERGAQVGRRLDRGRSWRPAGSATSTFAAMSVTRAPRSSAASAIATPILPVERLPMKRTGSIGSRVPPAVTTTWRPARSASRAGSTSGGRAAGSGGTDRAIGDGRDDRVDDRRQLRQAPDARLARRERPGLRLDDRVAELAQPGDVGDRRRVASTCRRPSPARRRPAPRSRGTSRSPRRRPGRWPSRPASGRSPARRRSRRRCRRRRCGRSGRRAAGRAGRSRPGGATVPRTRADRRSGSRTGSASRRRRRPRRAAGGAARRPCRRRSSRSRRGR